MFSFLIFTIITIAHCEWANITVYSQDDCSEASFVYTVWEYDSNCQPSDCKGKMSLSCHSSPPSKQKSPGFIDLYQFNNSQCSINDKSIVFQYKPNLCMFRLGVYQTIFCDVNNVVHSKTCGDPGCSKDCSVYPHPMPNGKCIELPLEFVHAPPEVHAMAFCSQ